MRLSQSDRGMPVKARSKATIAVLAIAAILRLIVAHHALSPLHADWFYARGNEMGYIAASILSGHGFAGPFGQETGPTAMIAPGYPWIVAAVFRVFGTYSPQSAWVLICLNISLNVLCTWMVLTLARQIASENAAIYSGLFYATFPTLLWMPTIFWETNLSSAFLLAPILLLYTRLKSRRPPPWAWLGVCIGAASLINPALAPTLLVLVLVGGFIGRYPLKKLLLTFVMAIVIYSPWPLRNWKVFHAWIPTRSTLGLELWMGNHEGSNGFLDQSLFPTYNASELARYRETGEVAYTLEKERAAGLFIRNHPKRFLLLSAERGVRFWFGTGNLHDSWSYRCDATITTCLGFLGLASLLGSRDKGRSLILLVPLLLFPIPYCITHAEFRYRLLLDPLLAATSALALDRIRAAFKFRKSIRRRSRLGNASGLDYV